MKRLAFALILLATGAGDPAIIAGSLPASKARVLTGIVGSAPVARVVLDLNDNTHYTITPAGRELLVCFDAQPTDIRAQAPEVTRQTPALEAQTSATGSILTFDEAVVLAGGGSSPSTGGPLRSQVAALRRSLLPSVRLETTANVSRTLDMFADGPLDMRSTQSVLAFDYPLWNSGLTRARIDSVEGKLRRLGEGARLDDSRFNQLLDVFGQLYLAQRQSALLRPLYERLSDEASRSALLVSTGEITNLAAADWREIALSFGSQLLELDARRIDAAARLQLLTGLEEEPTVVIDVGEARVDAEAAASQRDDQSAAMNVAVEESRLRLQEVMAANRLRASLSGFVGFGAAESQFRGIRADGAFGVYGLRVHLSYPLLGGAAAIQIAEARVGLQQTLAWQDTAKEAARMRASEYRLRAQIAERRIALLNQSVAAARDREESLARLVSGGLRAQSDLVRAKAERTRREVDLLASEIERWKAARLLARITAPAEDAHR